MSHFRWFPFALALAACGEAPAPVAPPPLVRTMVVGSAASDAVRAYSGEVRARHETILAFRVGGKIVERLVDVGAVVKPGQPLARIDTADLQLMSRQAEANRAFAAAEAKRYQDLKARNFVSQAALDAKDTALTAAAAQEALSRNQETYAVLRADKAGVIAQVLAEPGQVVAAGQGVFRLAESGALEVAISLPESNLEGVKPGHAAEVSLWSGSRPLRGALRELSPMADPVTRTFAARVALVESDPRVALGMTATVRFDTPRATPTTIPLAALFQRPGADGGAAVWQIADDGTVSLRPVTVGAYTDGGVIIAAGLAGGERIAAAGVHKLTAGQKVRMIEVAR